MGAKPKDGSAKTHGGYSYVFKSRKRNSEAISPRFKATFTPATIKEEIVVFPGYAAGSEHFCALKIALNL